MLSIIRTATIEINYQFTITKGRKMDIDDYFVKDNNILPTEISFEDYQSLDKEDINKLYPKDSMEEENKKANSLHTKATGTFDKILNSVLFNKELELDNSEFSKILSNDIDLILNSWEFPEQFTFTMEKTEMYIQRDYLIFPPPFPCCCCCFNPYNSVSQTITRNHLEYTEITEVLDEQKKINADDLFRTFENTEEAYRKKSKEFEKSTTEHFSYAKKIFSYYDSIKEEYQKRISEKGEILNYYTKNSGVNLIDNRDANVEDDLYGLLAWRDMSNEEKNEYAEKLEKQYLKTEYKGKDIQAGIKASTEIIKRNLASEFDDTEI